MGKLDKLTEAPTDLLFQTTALSSRDAFGGRCLVTRRGFWGIVIPLSDTVFTSVSVDCSTITRGQTSIYTLTKHIKASRLNTHMATGRTPPM